MPQRSVLKSKYALSPYFPCSYSPLIPTRTGWVRLIVGSGWCRSPGRRKRATYLMGEYQEEGLG